MPANEAFEVLPLDTVGQLLTTVPDSDPSSSTTWSRAGCHPRLAGEHPTYDDDTLDVTISGDDVQVGLQGAEVMCGNIKTLDPTIYVIDAALVS